VTRARPLRHTLRSYVAERVSQKAPPIAPIPPPRPPVVRTPSVQDCDIRYSYQEIKAMASANNLPRHLTRKDEMCAELIKRGLL
jgi:hypothetical protein